jgi:hypothetical protein
MFNQLNAAPSNPTAIPTAVPTTPTGIYLLFYDYLNTLVSLTL